MLNRINITGYLSYIYINSSSICSYTLFPIHLIWEAVFENIPLTVWKIMGDRDYISLDCTIEMEIQSYEVNRPLSLKLYLFLWNSCI